MKADSALHQFQRLCEIVARLRGPDGCPWDREQTLESLLPGLLEETYEIVGAVQAGDDLNLREELGDLLLIIVMQVQIAQETGRFRMDEVLNGVNEKLVRRHPHVFAATNTLDSGAALKQWEAMKHDEKKHTNARYLDHLPTALPALMRAQKVQNKVARVNFDWSDLGPVLAKVDEELSEAKTAIQSGDQEAIADEVGDLLFAVVNLARKSKQHAETTLQSATDKFIARFHLLEEELRAQGKQLGNVELDELDAIWNRVKHAAR